MCHTFPCCKYLASRYLAEFLLLTGVGTYYVSRRSSCAPYDTLGWNGSSPNWILIEHYSSKLLLLSLLELMVLMYISGLSMLPPFYWLTSSSIYENILFTCSAL